jgi:hypothetical protein
MKIGRNRDMEREGWIYNEIQKLRLRTVMKGFVKFWSKMKPDEIICFSRSLLIDRARD